LVVFIKDEIIGRQKVAGGDYGWRIIGNALFVYCTQSCKRSWQILHT